MMTYKLGSSGPTVAAIQKALHLYPDGIYGKVTMQAVMDWQREHHLTPDGVVGLRTAAALLGSLYKKSRRQITELIIHCSATPAGQNVHASDIRRWHKQQGWSDIGYHYVIDLDGTVELGRDVDLIGAHCNGHNTHSIGICYVGGCMPDGKTPADTRTEAQKAALACLLLELRQIYPKAAIHGHRDFAQKACPCFDAAQEYRHF